jgi:hypothetical protein
VSEKPEIARWSWSIQVRLTRAGHSWPTINQASTRHLPGASRAQPGSTSSTWRFLFFRHGRCGGHKGKSRQSQRTQLTPRPITEDMSLREVYKVLLSSNPRDNTH